MMYLAIFLLMIAFGPVQAQLEAIYVNDDSNSLDTLTTAIGSESGDGSADNPYASIQQALDQAPEGALIRVDAGAYPDLIEITKSVKIEGSSELPEVASIRIEATDVELSHLVLRGIPNALVIEDSSGVSIHDTVADGYEHAAIWARDSQDISVDNFVSAGGNYGADLDGSDIQFSQSKGYHHYAISTGGLIEGYDLEQRGAYTVNVGETLPASAERTRYITLDNQQIFTVDIPNSVYNVCVTVGRPNQNAQKQSISVNGVPFFNVVTASGNQVNDRCMDIAVNSGQLILIGNYRPGQAGPTYLSRLVIRNETLERDFSFGAEECLECADGVILEYGEMYDIERGYGWSESLIGKGHQQDGVWQHRSFPSLAVLPGEELLMVYYVSDGHQAPDGHLEVFRSLDAGLTWAYLGNIVDEGCDARNQALSVFPDGMISLVYDCRYHGSNTIEFKARVSYDDGLSWSQPIGISNDLGQGLTLRQWRDNGVYIDDQVLIAATVSSGAQHGCAVLQSSDGISFSLYSIIGMDHNTDFSECALVQRTDGRMVAVARYDTDIGNPMMFVSGDQAINWSDRAALDLYGFPPDLLPIGEELMLLVGTRTTTYGGGIVAYRSYDGGRLWNPERSLVVRNDFYSIFKDYGYPSAVINCRGELVVAYYGASAGDYSFVGVSVYPEGSY